MSLLNEFHANGKLLLTGEYAVLDGALSLALPCKLGQKLEVHRHPSNTLLWQGLTVNNETWFTCELNSDFSVIHTNDDSKTLRLIGLLEQLITLNPAFRIPLFGSKVITRLEFDQQWGLGSSSTLIHLLSQWAEVNPFQLLTDSFQGSGYDIASAGSNFPILYQKTNEKPHIKRVDFSPQFKNHLFFIYLGKKQFSDKEIVKFNQLDFNRAELAASISDLTEQIVSAKNLETFCDVLEKHETLLSNCLGYEKVKDRFFSTIPGTFKSLGAWGGDFVLFAGDSREIPAIIDLGYSTILGWNDLFNPLQE